VTRVGRKRVKPKPDMLRYFVDEDFREEVNGWGFFEETGEFSFQGNGVKMEMYASQKAFEDAGLASGVLYREHTSPDCSINHFYSFVRYGGSVFYVDVQTGRTTVDTEICDWVTPTYWVLPR